MLVRSISVSQLPIRSDEKAMTYRRARFSRLRAGTVRAANVVQTIRFVVWAYSLGVGRPRKSMTCPTRKPYPTLTGFSGSRNLAS